MVAKICENCSRPFETIGRGKTCSVKCSQERTKFRAAMRTADRAEQRNGHNFKDPGPPDATPDWQPLAVKDVEAEWHRALAIEGKDYGGVPIREEAMAQ